VIMNEGQASYADMIAAGWNDQAIIDAGLGTENYTFSDDIPF